MPKKKRASKKALKYLTDFTRDKMVERGLWASPENSIIEKIKATAGAPMLPGLREYLPQPLMLNLGRRAILDFGREWQTLTKDSFKQNSFDEFFRFVVKRVNAENYAFTAEMNKRAKEINDLIAQGKDVSSRTVGEWLRPQDMMDLIKGLGMFLMDSFAVCVATKAAGDTPEFLEWYLRWTQQLLNYWPQDLRSIGANIYNGAKPQVDNRKIIT